MMLSLAGVPVSESSWTSHLDIVQLILVIGFGYIVWSARRTLLKIDTSIEDLYRKYDIMHADFYTLKGEHSAMKEQCAVNGHQRRLTDISHEIY
jgi:hypothetical protein